MNTKATLSMLSRWARSAEACWYETGEADSCGNPLGCYGTGYNSWGVQTNQKYLAAMASLACPCFPSQREREWALGRSLAALRFSLASHLTGEGRCTDGTSWGHTWISALGIERMMYGVYLLKPHMTDVDRDALRRVLLSEASWIADEMQRGNTTGIVGGLWNDSGLNVPESNLWNGCLLWRAASMYPDAPRADHWKEQAHRYFVNGVSVPGDADDRRVVAGRPIAGRFAGPNFFPHYALDHHGYLNVGYMAICTSNAAILHFDMKSQGLPRPDTLDHHQGDLWSVLRRMVFGDGRLARIGGDSRVRYAYCQEYLLPSLLYAADRWQDPDAVYLVRQFLELMAREQAANPDGSFYGRRLAALAEESPYYYTRLESDRASVLGMLAAWSDHVDPPPEPADPPNHFERSVAGGWWEPEHGAVLHRSPTRLASFAWRAYGLAQGMCQPPQDGALAEWEGNLCGSIRFLGDDASREGRRLQQRKLVGCHVTPFEGGFATCGSVLEGMNLTMAEGWRGTESALHHIAFVALPDAHTVIGMEFCRAADRRTYLAEIKGLHLNLPNDLHNGNLRKLTTQNGEIQLSSPPPRDEVSGLGTAWASIEGRISVVGLYGARELSVSRSRFRRGGRYRSLHVEEICWPCAVGTTALDPSTVILDSGWAVISGVSARKTRSWAEASTGARIQALPPHLRALAVPAVDGVGYLIAANFGEDEQHLDLGPVRDQLGRDIHLAAVPGSREPEQMVAPRIPAREVRIWRIG